MTKTLSWEEYADELKVRLDDKTAECDKLKQQLAIAVKSLSTITNCAPACFRTKECPLEGGYGFDNGCFRCGYATAFEALQQIKELNK